MMLPLSATNMHTSRLGCNLESVGHVDSVTFAHEDPSTALRGESLSTGRPDFHRAQVGLAPKLSDKLCRQNDVAAPESTTNSF